MRDRVVTAMAHVAIVCMALGGALVLLEDGNSWYTASIVGLGVFVGGEGLLLTKDRDNESK